MVYKRNICECFPFIFQLKENSFNRYIEQIIGLVKFKIFFFDKQILVSSHSDKTLDLLPLNESIHLYLFELAVLTQSHRISMYKKLNSTFLIRLDRKLHFIFSINSELFPRANDYEAVLRRTMGE